jgi:class 3 adenylate cyclase
LAGAAILTPPVARQVSSCPHLFKADAVGDAYTVVGFGDGSVAALLALALQMRAGLDSLRPPAGAAGAWGLRVAVVRGAAVAGGLGSQQFHCHFLGPATAEAERVLQGCPAGEIRVQRHLARAAAGSFVFAAEPRQPQEDGPGAARGARGAATLCGRRGILGCT